jgi:hypothetical protein
MSVDTTFQPKTSTYAVDNTAGGVTIDGRQAGVTSWRIRWIQITPVFGSSGYIKWAPPGSSPSAASGPAIGFPLPNEIGVNLGQTVYLDGIGADLTFIGNAGGGTSYFEITGGQGGCGG